METKLHTAVTLSYLFFFLAILTLIPFAGSKTNLAGFHTLCAFAPASTIYLLGAGLYFRDRSRRIKAWMVRQALKRLEDNSRIAA